MRGAWEGILMPPLGGRTGKPRQSGITFLSVKGWGPSALRDLVLLAAPYVDRVKLAFGHTLLIPEQVLREKIAILRAADIEVNPGGTCAEIAIYQQQYPAFLKQAQSLGFTTIEISDGTITMDNATRERAIKQALDAGLKVVSEVGKKDTAQQLDLDDAIRQIKRDFGYGVSKVTIESRASAKGIGVYDAEGKVKDDDVARIVAAVDPDGLIWEAPHQAAQEYFIKRFGNNVNLGNVKPDEIIALEALRNGLRGDTFRLVAS